MVPASSPLRVALLVVAAIGVVVAGGFVLLSEEPSRPSAEAIDNATERFESLDGVTARLETNITIGNETTRIVRRIEARPGTGKYRSESIGGTASGADTVVSNGTVTWYYDSDNRTAYRINTDAVANGTILSGGRPVEQLLSAAFGEDNESVGVSALPMVSASASGRPSGALPANQSAIETNVTYLDTEQVSDRRTYLFELRQVENGTFGNYSGRIWIDAERSVILRQHTNFTIEGQHYETETRYRNVSFDAELDDERFEFEPPANATVSSSQTRQFDSREAVVAAAELDVPNPDVPEDFEFERGTHTVTEQRSVSAQYTNGSASITVSVRSRTATTNDTSDGPDSARNVQIGSANGTLQFIGEARMLDWECGDRSYSVLGSGVGNETVIETARSVGCE